MTPTPTLAELEQDYRLYCVTLPAERTPDSFTAYVYHALAQQIDGLQYCHERMNEQNKVLRDGLRVMVARWMKEKVKA